MVRNVHHHLIDPTTRTRRGFYPSPSRAAPPPGHASQYARFCLRRRTGIQSPPSGFSQGREPQGRPCKRCEPTGSTPSQAQTTNAAAGTTLALRGPPGDRLEGRSAHSCRTQKNMTLRTTKLSSSRPTGSPHRRTLSRACSNAWFATHLEFIPVIARKRDPEHRGGQPAPRHDLRAR
jgi:hypothetical protein